MKFYFIRNPEGKVVPETFTTQLDEVWDLFCNLKKQAAGPVRPGYIAASMAFGHRSDSVEIDIDLENL